MQNNNQESNNDFQSEIGNQTNIIFIPLRSAIDTFAPYKSFSSLCNGLIKSLTSIENENIEIIVRDPVARSLFIVQGRRIEDNIFYN